MGEGITQTQLAKMLGISDTYLSMILRWKRKAPEALRSHLPSRLYMKNAKNVDESGEFRSDDPIVELIVNEEHGIFRQMMEDWKKGEYEEDIMTFIDSDRFELFMNVVNPSIDVDAMREKLKQKLFSMKKK